MKIPILTVIAVALCAVATATETIEEKKPAFKVTASVMLRSEYTDSDVGVLLYNKGVVQGDVTVTHEPSGVFLTLWASTGFNSRSDWDKEVDLIMGWNGKVGIFDLTLSATYADDFNVGQFSYNDVLKGSVRVSLPSWEVNKRLTLTPFASYSVLYIPDKNTPFEGGNVASVGLESEIKFAEKLTLSSSTAFSRDDGPYGLIPGWLFKHTSTLNWELSDRLVWNVVEFSTYVPLGNRQIQTRSVLGTGFSFGF